MALSKLRRSCDNKAGNTEALLAAQKVVNLWSRADLSSRNVYTLLLSKEYCSEGFRILIVAVLHAEPRPCFLPPLTHGRGLCCYSTSFTRITEISTLSRLRHSVPWSLLRTSKEQDYFEGDVVRIRWICARELLRLSRRWRENPGVNCPSAEFQMPFTSPWPPRWERWCVLYTRCFANTIPHPTQIYYVGKYC